MAEGVTGISKEAFYGCTSLVAVKLPISLSTISIDAFYMCDRLNDVVYAGDATDFSAVRIMGGNSALTDAYNKKNM